MSDERAFIVILEEGGRMRPCRHQHHTREEADACVAACDGLAIVEWERDRRPQFSFSWLKDGLDPDNKMLSFIKRFN